MSSKKIKVNVEGICKRIADKKQVICMGIILLVLITIMLAGFVRVVLPSSQSSTWIFKNLSAENEKIEITELGEEFRQEFSGVSETIETIYLSMFCEEEDSESSIKVVVSVDGEKIAEKACIFDDEDMKEFLIELDEPVEITEDSVLSISFVDEGNYKKGTGLVGVADWKSPRVASYQGENENEFEIAMAMKGGNSKFVLKMYVAVIGVLFVTYFILCGGILKNKWKTEQVFVLLATAFGLLYAIFWSPYSCPDEAAHISTVYYYSSEILQEPTVDEKGETLFEEADFIYPPSEKTPGKYSYYLYQFIGEDIENGEELVTQGRAPLTGMSPINYAPQVIATTIVRALDGGSIMWLLLGRVFALMLYVICGYFAIKWMPFAKRALLVLLLGPSAIQQAASFSYDCVLNCCAMIFVAYALHLAYEKQKVAVKDWLILGISSVILSPIKVIYIVLLLLIVLIPNKKISTSNLKALLAKASLFFINIVSIVVMRTSSVVAITTSTVTEAGAPGYDIGMILSNPLKVFVLWANTLRVKPADYLRHIFGGVEFANNVSISWFIILGFYILLVLALLVEDKERIIDMKGRLVSIIITLGLFVAILLVFTLAKDCTSIYSTNVIGIQGRYFIPFLPLLFTAIQSKNIVVKKSIESQLIIGIYSFQFITMLTIFETIIAR